MLFLRHYLYDQDGWKIDYVDYDINKKVFFENEQVKKLYKKYFADFYKISEEAAENILDDYDLWEDTQTVEQFLEDCMEELDEIFFVYDYIDPLNRP